MNEIAIREATEADLHGILQVEQSWPESGRAGAEKFVSRIRRFGTGFFLAVLPDTEHGGERIVATITSMPIDYSPEHVERLSNWDCVTHGGYLPECLAAEATGLYIVSGVIDCAYRGLPIFAPMVLRVARLAQDLGLRYVLAGAVVPGYGKYCEQHGDIPAFDYCTARRGQHLVDPLLALYKAIGFEVPDARHVVANYFPDAPSRDYAAVVVRDLRQRPLVD